MKAIRIFFVVVLFQLAVCFGYSTGVKTIFAQSREVRVAAASGSPGQVVNLSIELNSLGNENGIGFSISYNQAIFTNPVITAGSGASGATVISNINQSSSGRIGALIGLPAGQVFQAGVRQVVNISFTVSQMASGSYAVAFGDQPIARGVVDIKADTLSANFASGTINISAPTPVTGVSAASFLGDQLAPESIVAAFGTNMATGTGAATSLPLPTSILGTNVVVKDALGAERQAPLFFVSPTQINYLIPAGTVVGTAMVTVTSGDNKISTGAQQISNVAPGLFTVNSTGQGLVAATALRIKQNGAQIYEPVAQFDQSLNRFVAIPINLGPEGEQVILAFFGTGLRFRSGLQAVNVKIGGIDCEVLFAGTAPDFTGLDQVNVRLPRTLIGRKEVDLVMTVDGKPANTARISID